MYAMDPTSQLRLSLGFLSTAISMLYGTDKGRRNILSHGAIEILYTSYFSPVCMGDIAGMLGITPSSATDLVNHLEREGFIRRVRDPENRRTIRVEPADRGELWILENEEKIYGFLESHLARLSPEERVQFVDLCSRFSGVSDDLTFLAGINAVKRDRGSMRVPLISRKDGKLQRLEEMVDQRYRTDPYPKNSLEDSIMISERIPETSDGIQDEGTVMAYDAMQRGLRDSGNLPVSDLVAMTCPGDHALEVGPGPGYYGLEWIRSTRQTTLTGLEISPAMIRLAEKNTREYGLQDRVRYREGNALSMPFDDESFTLAFSNGSLHEWEDPGRVLKGIYRVLKPGGKMMVTDLRRDLAPDIFSLMQESCRSEEIRAGFVTSVQAAYRKDELEEILAPCGFSGVKVIAHPYGLVAIGTK